MKIALTLLLAASLIGSISSCKKRIHAGVIRAQNQSNVDASSVTLRSPGGEEFKFGALISGGNAVAQIGYPISDGETHTLSWIAEGKEYSKIFIVNLPEGMDIPKKLNIVITKDLELRASYN